MPPQPRVLMLLLEYPGWKQARHVSYCAQFGLVEALRANGADCTVLTTPWLKHAKKIVASQKYDQVWVDIVHSNLGDRLFQDGSFLEWLTGLAPVRLGLIAESLNYTETEKEWLPILRTRGQSVRNRLQYLTHVAACDEKDAAEIGRQMPAIWWPQGVPDSDIVEPVSLPQGPAVFGGSLYGERTQWLSNPSLKGSLVYLVPPESSTLDPLRFRLLHWHMQARTHLNATRLLTTYQNYTNSLRVLRRRFFSLWLTGLRQGSAVVNLPHFVKTYAGRVFEGFAAGRPVISWHIPDRPLNEALFDNRNELLLFEADAPDQLREHIRRIQEDPVFARQLVIKGQVRLRQHHTLEKRSQQILRWLEQGDRPDYGIGKL